MTVEGERSAKFIVNTCMKLQPGEQFLAIADNLARPRWIAELITEAAVSFGADAALLVITPRTEGNLDPPPEVESAMKAADAIIHVYDRVGIFHTNATKQAFAAGSRFYTIAGLNDDEFEKEVSFSDLEQISNLTERVALLLEEASEIRITSRWGTNLAFQLSHRPAFRIHPLHPIHSILPHYAEVAVSPLEGTCHGVVAITEILGWDYVFQHPLKVTIVDGRAKEVHGTTEEGGRLDKLLSTDINARNFPAEFAIGTSHLIRKGLRGTREDAGRLGMIHLAFGRNDTLHGTVWSRVHDDGLITGATVQVDEKFVVKEGRLLVEP